MNKKVFLILALLCAVFHGAWAKTEAGTNEAQLADVNNGGDMHEATVTEYSWDEVNKQLADKERVAAALENANLMGILRKMMKPCLE